MRSGWKTAALAGWGRVRRAEMQACRPERVTEAQRAVEAVGPEGLIAHGNGRSYGDAALNDGGRAMLTRRLDRVLDFDAARGVLVAEPGITYGELLRLFLPRGFLIPVTPGTAFATLGGAVACDVHGKNHESAGSLGDHLLWLDLLIASGEVVRVSPEERPDLFAATVGGMGLTGVILAVAVRMSRAASPDALVRERRVADLDAFIAALDDNRRKATYSVGWIDGLARGGRLGRGVLELAEPAPAADRPSITRAARRSRRVPVDLPGAILNPYSVALFNAAYFRRVPAAGRERRMALERFFYPLDAVLDWNRIYGRRGFHQFQCVVPDGEAPSALRGLLETISAARGASFLAVLKTLGGEGRGHLSFPLRGYTLALDLPRASGAEELMARLERLTLDHGGRIYLAKDSCLSPSGFAAMYPKLDRFRAMLEEVDPEGRFASDMARRLRIRGVPS